MPQLGETVTEGTVSAWHKQIGDPVEADEIILDIETDKVSMEIPAPVKGRLTRILVEAGQTVGVGTVLGVVQAEGEEQTAVGSARQQAGSAAQAGGAKAAAVAGGGKAPSVAAGAKGGNGAARVVGLAERGEQMRLSPAVRRLAAEHALELAEIEGSGRNGRITRRDVIRFLETGPAARSAPAAAQARRASPAIAQAGTRPVASVGAASAASTKFAPPAASRAAARSEARTARPAGAPALAGGTVPFNRIRKLTAEHMVRSKATSPHVLQAVEVDFSAVDGVRKAVREAWRGRHGYSLTYLPFIAHAVCEALAEFPH
ncbi:MAG TPA: biotin/lipoyl-containing protein, partial [Gammaproteobacteria bacterium]|nr:biotin/lipoyl-containing protein [Gammaproteobacteria bacterium]